MEVIANLFIAIMFFIIGVGVGNNKQKKQNNPEEKEKRPAFNRKAFKKEKAEENLRLIRENRYRQKRVCNANERAAYIAALSVVLRREKKERVLAQVTLGEMLYHENSRVHGAVNSKRVDILVTDDSFNPLIAIEIDGSGHHLSNYSHINDEGKMLALKSAGIPLLRILASTDDAEDIKRQVRDGLERFFAGLL